jgi:hypothetical protein
LLSLSVCGSLCYKLIRSTIMNIDQRIIQELKAGGHSKPSPSQKNFSNLDLSKNCIQQWKKSPRDRTHEIETYRFHIPTPIERRNLRIPASIDRLNIQDRFHFLILCGGENHIEFAVEVSTQYAILFLLFVTAGDDFIIHRK